MASGQLFNGSIMCSFLSENNLLFRRTVHGIQTFLAKLSVSHLQGLSFSADSYSPGYNYFLQPMYNQMIYDTYWLPVATPIAILGACQSTLLCLGGAARAKPSISPKTQRQCYVVIQSLQTFKHGTWPLKSLLN